MFPGGEPPAWGQSWEEEGDAEGLSPCALLEPLRETLVSASPGASLSACHQVCPEVSQQDQVSWRVWVRRGSASRLWEPLWTPVHGTVMGCPPSTAPSCGRGARSQRRHLYPGHRHSPGPPWPSQPALLVLSASLGGREGGGGNEKRRGGQQSSSSAFRGRQARRGRWPPSTAQPRPASW